MFHKPSVRTIERWRLKMQVSKIVEALSDDRPPIVAAASKALGALRATPALVPLLNVFEFGPIDAREAARVAIAAIGLELPANRGLTDGLAETSDEVAARVVSAILGKCRDGERLTNCIPTVRDATERGHENVVTLLIEKGATTEEMNEALLAAATAGHISIIGLLLAAGADVDTPNEDGTTPLGVSVLGGHSAVADSLLQAGANPDPIDRKGNSPLILAAWTGDVALIHRLLETGARVDLASDCRDALSTAAEAGHLDAMKTLIAHGAALESTIIGDRDTPLIKAIANGHGQAVRLLIESGADPNRHASSLDTPLTVAAHKGQLEVVDQLINSGADVNATASNNITAVWAAAASGFTAVVDRLVSAGADLNRTAGGDSDCTALMIAAANGSGSVVDRLVLAGAEVNALQSDGYTALSYCMSGEEETAADRERIVDLLVQSGADLDVRYPDDESILHIAARFGETAIVGRLLAAGANAGTTNNNGLTPARSAAIERHDATRSLLDNHMMGEGSHCIESRGRVVKVTSDFDTFVRDVLQERQGATILESFDAYTPTVARLAESVQSSTRLDASGTAMVGRVHCNGCHAEVSTASMLFLMRSSSTSESLKKCSCRGGELIYVYVDTSDDVVGESDGILMLAYSRRRFQDWWSDKPWDQVQCSFTCKETIERGEGYSDFGSQGMCPKCARAMFGSAEDLARKLREDSGCWGNGMLDRARAWAVRDPMEFDTLRIEVERDWTL